jgi:hypothetical protein
MIKHHPQQRTPEAFSRLQGVQKAKLPDTIKKSLADSTVPRFDLSVNPEAVKCPPNH